MPFESEAEEVKYLEGVKRELDAAKTKADVAEVFRRHFMVVGHKKIARLLLGKTPEQAVRRRNQ